MMNETDIRCDWDLVIVRPYISLPHESAGIDRYFSLFQKMSELGFKCLLIASNFHHNKKQFRIPNSVQYDNVVFIDAGSYVSNHSLSRVVYEMNFMLRSSLFLRNTSTKAVLIGEPVFGVTIFSLVMKFRKCILISDVIDLMPEALRVKIRSDFLYQAVAIPLHLIRRFRTKFLLDFVSVVSESYKKILNLDDTKSNVFYWGLNQVDNIIPIRENRVKRVIYAGSLGDGYDIETIINLAEIRDDIKIIIAGSGPQASLCKEADKRGVITYLGQVGKGELRELYLTSDIGLLPYKKNSAVAMPIKFFDYISYDLKIVSSLNLESSDIILQNKIGCVYESESLTSLSSSIDKVIELPYLKDKFDTLKRFYDLDRQYDNFTKKIISLIS
jgi:glycosyltransferase involved in cell wall biosynthesis